MGLSIIDNIINILFQCFPNFLGRDTLNQNLNYQENFDSLEKENFDSFEKGNFGSFHDTINFLG
jgi:hypothetical protein